jgi:hypothetical protein
MLNMSRAHSVRISYSLEAYNLQRNLNDSFLQGEMQEMIKIKIRDLLKQKNKKILYVSFYTLHCTGSFINGVLGTYLIGTRPEKVGWILCLFFS